MNYAVKAGDTLSGIAKLFHLPLALLVSVNKITNPNLIKIGQRLEIPSFEDLPRNLKITYPATKQSLIDRARTAVGKGIAYRLPKVSGEGAYGGYYQTYFLPTKDNYCDCSGFICWVLGLSRVSKIPFYKALGGYINTDGMVKDINSTSGIFEKLNEPELGCIVVYGRTKGHYGHVGLVSEVTEGKISKVIHCSNSNYIKFHDAIQETDGHVFNRPDAVFGKFVG